jgi:hypothetical protein
LPDTVIRGVLRLDRAARNPADAFIHASAR